MAHPIALSEGQQITHTVGRMTVALTCIRENASYRASVHLGSTAGLLGAEVDCLSASYPTEVEARHAARRATIAFKSVPADVPFAVAVEQALESIAAQLDEAIAKALGGGDGTGRHAQALPGLTRARQAIKTPRDRIVEAELVARLTADLEAYDTDANYRAACDQAVTAERELANPDAAWELRQRNQALVAADRGSELSPTLRRARSLREMRDRHAAALERDRAARRYAHIT